MEVGLASWPEAGARPCRPHHPVPFQRHGPVAPRLLPSISIPPLPLNFGNLKLSVIILTLFINQPIFSKKSACLFIPVFMFSPNRTIDTIFFFHFYQKNRFSGVLFGRRGNMLSVFCSFVHRALLMISRNMAPPYLAENVAEEWKTPEHIINYTVSRPSDSIIGKSTDENAIVGRKYFLITAAIRVNHFVVKFFNKREKKEKRKHLNRKISWNSPIHSPVLSVSRCCSVVLFEESLVKEPWGELAVMRWERHCWCTTRAETDRLSVLLAPTVATPRWMEAYGLKFISINTLTYSYNLKLWMLLFASTIASRY